MPDHMLYRTPDIICCFANVYSLFYYANVYVNPFILEFKMYAHVMIIWCAIQLYSQMQQSTITLSLVPSNSSHPTTVYSGRYEYT